MLPRERNELSLRLQPMQPRMALTLFTGKPWAGSGFQAEIARPVLLVLLVVRGFGRDGLVARS